MATVKEMPADDGTGGSFEAFFAMNYERLVQAMWVMSGNRWDAEDLAQESMTRMYERWDRVHEAEHPEGYAYVIALNLHRRRLRRSIRSRHWRHHDIEHADPLEAVDTRDQLRRALRSLPRTQAEALILVEWLDLTSEEAARVLKIESTSVRGRLHRARATVRQAMGGPDE